MTPNDNQKYNSGLLQIIGSSFLIACFLLWDAIASGGSRVVGASGAEIWAFLWGHFWFAQSIIEHGQWPQFTLLSDFPDGGALWLKDPIMLVAMLPFQIIFGIPTAVTVSQICLFILAALGMYLLCRQLGISKNPALIAGWVYAFCPHTLGEAFNGNIEALNTCWLPLWLWSWLKVMDEKNWKNILFSGGVLFLLLIGNQYWGLAMAFVAPLIFLFKIIQSRTRWRSVMWGASASVGVGIILFSPVGWWILESLQHENRLNDITSGNIIWTVPYLSDIKHLYSPMSELWKLEVKPPPFQDIIYPGFILVLLALVSPFFKKHRPLAIFSLGLSLFFVLLSFGPALSYDGELIRSCSGNMYALPWYYLITNNPIFNWMTLPHRMIIPATLFLSLGLGITLNQIRGNKWLWSIAALLLLDSFYYPPYTVPLVTTSLPKADHALFLGHIPQKGALLNIPVNLTSNHMRIYFWYQTIHKRPIAMSLRYSEFPSIAKTVPFVHLSNELTQAVLPNESDSDPLNIDGLRESGFGFVLVHSPYLREFLATEPEIYLQYANAHLGNGVVFSDESVLYPLEQADFPEIMKIAEEALGSQWVLGESIDRYGLPQMGSAEE